MKVVRERYQHGSVRKVPRSRGFAWEFRFYITTPEGVRKLKVQTFDPAKYPTEKDVRAAVAGQLSALNAGTLGGKVDATLGTILGRYMREEFPHLRHSTQDTNRSLINLHLRPKWGDVRLTDVTANEVKRWLDGLQFGAASKARARNIISKLLDLAMLWEYIPVARNPMSLVKVKGSTKRKKKKLVITAQQFKALVLLLPEPYNLMAVISAFLGLRVSEVLALKWADFDAERGELTIRRVFTHGAIQEVPKSEESGEPIPVHPQLMSLLKQWQDKQKHGYAWVFASPKTGSPYSDSTILTKYLKPAAAKLGIVETERVGGLGWHTFRHSYKSWLAGAKVAPSIMKDLMRHADIATTMNVYGDTVPDEMREANALVVEKLLAEPEP